MGTIPDTSNFFSSLHTAKSLREVAGLFGAAGWEVREPDDSDHVEVLCPWAELVIESGAPILMHGPVADVEVNAERILAVLRRADVTVTAECYGVSGKLLREWHAAEPRRL